MLAREWSPGSGRGPCWHCRWFAGMVLSDIASCGRDEGHVRAMASRGCAFWQREPGADDEPGPPPVIGWERAVSRMRAAP